VSTTRPETAFVKCPIASAYQPTADDKGQPTDRTRDLRDLKGGIARALLQDFLVPRREYLDFFNELLSAPQPL
jgi:hypothetical protein